MRSAYAARWPPAERKRAFFSVTRHLFLSAHAPRNRTGLLSFVPLTRDSLPRRVIAKIGKRARPSADSWVPSTPPRGNRVQIHNNFSRPKIAALPPLFFLTARRTNGTVLHRPPSEAPLVQQGSLKTEQMAISIRRPLAFDS
jgi:hypothetical protein